VMKKSATAFAILAFLVSAPRVLTQEKSPTEAYSGVAVGTGGTVGGKSISFDFRITQYTTDEELQNFAQLVKDKGTDALRSALEKEDKGRISAVGPPAIKSEWRANASKAPTPSLPSLPPAPCLFSSLPEAGAAVTTPSDIFR